MAIGIPVSIAGNGYDYYDEVLEEEVFGGSGIPYADEKLNEAAKIRTPTNGLWTDLYDIDKFVAINDLKEVTNSIMLSTSGFTDDGLLSYSIFGIDSYDRKNRFAFIDLKFHYMNPVAAVKLASYDRKLSDCLYANGRYKLTKEGELVEDPDGEAGPEFLYNIWGKIKVKDKTTVTTKQIQEFYEKTPKNILFMTKYPVIPAFYRDLDASNPRGSKGTNTINSWYTSLISYSQTMQQYTSAFAYMAYITQARVQQILVEIYNYLMVKTVKGQPSKFGMLRRAMAGKNLPYTSRLVLTGSNQMKSSLSQVQTKFRYATIPLMYCLSLFMPFIIHEAKNYFDAQFLQGGKIPYKHADGTIEHLTIKESFDENQITAMINKYINSPGSRFDEMLSPPDTNGKRFPMTITGRNNRTNTTFMRKATLTDVLYIIAERACSDKHVYITRYPMDNPWGQNPYRIIISTTTETVPVTIGNKLYEHFPVIKGDALNSFMTTCQFSNAMIEPMGADYDRLCLCPILQECGMRTA